MKKHITLGFILLGAVSALAQVSIGGNLTVEGNSTILDFNSTEGNIKGIILPAVDVDDPNKVLGAVPANNNGTFIFDKTSSSILMFEDSDWVNLSGTGDNRQIVNNTSDEITAEQGSIIGSRTSAARGVLVLESTDKAMILPRIFRPHANVKSPYPGMICYDSESRSLAVFDGAKWSYWK